MNRYYFSQRTIIRSLSSAVMVVDAEGRITTWNLVRGQYCRARGGTPSLRYPGPINRYRGRAAWDYACVRR